jgi:hypothetical protein
MNDNNGRHRLAGGLKDLDYFATTNTAMQKWFDSVEVRAPWHQHGEKRRDSGYWLFCLACLYLWMKHKLIQSVEVQP